VGGSKSKKAMYLNPLTKRASTSLFNYKSVLDYLKGRQMTEADLKKFFIGYVGISSPYLVKDDGSEDFIRLKNDTANFRHFEKKIFIPMRNCLGHVNGFSLRSIDKSFYRQYYMDEAKKVGTFFGLFDALPYIYKTGIAYVVEGPFDCIALAKVFPNTVSSLTSFLNEAQMQLLRMYAKKIILVFDSDKAGESGASKALEKYGEDQISIRYLGYKDPNQCLISMGEDSFKTYIKQKLETR
jgi:DNA primase